MANLCSLAEIKTFLGITTTAYDEKLNLVNSRVSDIIKNICNKKFEIETITNELHDGDGVSDKIFTKVIPIISVTSLIENNIVLSTDSYYIYKTYVQKKEAFSAGLQNIKISYQAGENVPLEINLAAIDWISILANQKILTYTTGEGVETAVTLTSIPEYIKQVCLRHRKVLI